ncbi:MAG: hypothetical protein V4669_02625 [Pseudomonadota bacterium]
MISRSMTDLGILRSREPRPSLEVQASGLEKNGIDLREIAATALRKLAEADPKLIATVYLFGTISINFGDFEPSEFLIPVGTERAVQRVLQALNAGVARLGPDVKSRMSDYVRPSDGVPFLHIEGGKVWEPEDALTWFTHTDDPASASELAHEASPQPSTQPAESESDWLDDSDEKELPDIEDPSAHTRLAKPLRVRRARSDASVGSIKSNIEQVFGLPEGSVALCGPDGKALRSDALIKTLRGRWE